MSSNAEEHLERVQAARKARVEGFVRLLDLEYFLACDESYSLDTLDKINTIFQVGGFSHDGSWSKEHRHGFWLLVLLRWTGIRSNAFKAKLKPIGRYLPAYKYDTASGDYHRIPAAGTNAGLFDKIYLSLNEVAGYMAKIRDAYQIEIYLPEPLKVVEPAQLEQESGIKFQVPEGTGWDQVTITAIDFQHVKIKTPLGEKRVHYADLGWIDRRRTGHAKYSGS